MSRRSDLDALAFAPNTTAYRMMPVRPASSSSAFVIVDFPAPRGTPIDWLPPQSITCQIFSITSLVNRDGGRVNHSGK